MKTIFKNLLRAVGFIAYFMVLIFAYTRMNIDRLTSDIKVFAGVFLIIGILAIERAYKDDNGKTAIIGIEWLVMSMHSLSILHITNIVKYEFKYYLIGSAIVVTIYYLIKGIVMSIKENREYLNNLSDVAEIVKKDEPIKKEAKKRNTAEESKTTTKKKSTKTTNKTTSQSKEKTNAKPKTKKEVKKND